MRDPRPAPTPPVPTPSVPTPSAPVTACPPRLDCAMTAEDALRAVLSSCVAQIEANLPAVLIAKDVEGLHQLRVGLRRWRTALDLAGTAPASALEARAKTMIAIAGEARDLDVFLADLLAPVEERCSPNPGFNIIRTHIEPMRGAAWQKVSSAVASARFKKLMRDGRKANDALSLAENPSAPEFAVTILDKALQRARKRGKGFKAQTPAERHRLRIALKKLRYGAEFFAPLFPDTDLKAWLAPLKELQDLLGHLNDCSQVHKVTAPLLAAEQQNNAAQSEVAYAVGVLLGYHQARHDLCAAKIHKRWKSFKTLDPFWT